MGGQAASDVGHHVRRNVDHARVAVDPAAAVGEDVEGLVVFDEHAGALEHLERGQVDVVDLVGREDVQRKAAAARSPGMLGSLHDLPPRA